jgi:hypothetical protein
MIEPLNNIFLAKISVSATPLEVSPKILAALPCRFLHFLLIRHV